LVGAGGHACELDEGARFFFGEGVGGLSIAKWNDG